MSRIHFTAIAQADIAAIATFIAEKNLPAAERFLDSVEPHCEKIADFPDMERSREELLPRLRSFPLGNYLIFYKVTDSGIEVLRVLHSARDIPSIFG